MITELLRQQKDIESQIEAWKTNVLAQLITEGKSSAVVDGVRVKVEKMKTKQKSESALAMAIESKILALECDGEQANKETLRHLQAQQQAIEAEIVRISNPMLPELRSKLAKERMKNADVYRLKIV